MTAANSPPFDMDMPNGVPSSVVEDLYELQTLHRGSRLEQSRWTPEKMAATAKREKKAPLTFKERFFGGKRNKKGNFGLVGLC